MDGISSSVTEYSLPGSAAQQALRSMRAFLSCIGLNDIEVINVEGVAFGPEVADNAVNAALARVSAIAA